MAHGNGPTCLFLRASSLDEALPPARALLQALRPGRSLHQHRKARRPVLANTTALPCAHRGTRARRAAYGTRRRDAEPPPKPWPGRRPIAGSSPATRRCRHACNNDRPIQRHGRLHRGRRRLALRDGRAPTRPVAFSHGPARGGLEERSALPAKGRALVVLAFTARDQHVAAVSPPPRPRSTRRAPAR